MTETAEHVAPEGATESAPAGGRASPDVLRGDDPTEIYRSATRLLRQDKTALPSRTRALLVDRLKQITDHVALAARREVARSLTADARPDGDLTALVLADRFEVAQPVLESHPALAEADLLRVVADGSAEHRRSVAARPGLPAAVAAALIETGEADILRLLLDNRSTAIPARGWPQLAQAARRHPELLAALQARPDLPADMAPAPTAADRPSDDAERAAAALAAKLHRAGHLRLSLLVGALRHKQVALFEHALARLTGVPVARLRRLIRDRSGYPLALAARGARMDRSAFSTVFVNYAEARGVSTQLNEGDFTRAMDVFRHLPQEGARAELHRLAGMPRPASPPRRAGPINPLLQS